MQAMQDLTATDTDMHDWFLERDVKMPQVILHDKLMTDALLGTLPIKTEHSYSLNSDGDSMPDSPNSLQNKMEGNHNIINVITGFFIIRTYITNISMYGYVQNA